MMWRRNAVGPAFRRLFMDDDVLDSMLCGDL